MCAWCLYLLYVTQIGVFSANFPGPCCVFDNFNRYYLLEIDITNIKSALISCL